MVIVRVLTVWIMSVVALCFPNTGYAQQRISTDGSTRGNGYWMVNAAVDGRRGVFLLALESRTTCVAARFLGRSSVKDLEEVHDITVGASASRRLNVAVIAKMVPAWVDGVIGQDALRDRSIGIDVNAAEVYLWDKSLDSRSAKRWVTDGPVIKEPKLQARVSLYDDSVHGAVLFRCGKSDWNMRSVICSLSGITRIQPELTRKLSWICLRRLDMPKRLTPGTVPSENGVAMGLDLGVGVTIPLYGVSVDDKEYPWFPLRRVALQLIVEDVPTRRLVINYKQRFLCIEQLSADGMCSWLATRWTGWPLAVKDGSLCIDPSYGPRMSPARDPRMSWAKVTSIGGIPSSEILAVLRNPTVQGVAKLSPILDPWHPSRAKISTKEADYDMEYTK